MSSLAAVLRERTQEQKEAELADVMAWPVTPANINNVDLPKALEAKHGRGRPGCGHLVCTCNAKP